MSKENLSKFLQLLSQDKELAAKAQAFEGDIDAIVSLGRENGYDFDRQELEAHQNKVVEFLKSRVKKNLDKQSQTFLPESKGVANIKALMKLAETDEAVAAKVAGFSSADPEAFLKYGREMGFEFEAKDMDALAQEIMEQSDELSDEELETAAGGTVLAGILTIAAFAAIAGVAAAGVGGAAIIGVKLLLK